MKIKDLIKELEKYDLDTDILISSDEELNTLFSDVQVAGLAGTKYNEVVLWGNSGTEVNEFDLMDDNLKN